MTRLEIATQILAGIVSADWKFDVPPGMKWDDCAMTRAYELADKLIENEKVVLSKPTKKRPLSN